MPFSTSTVHTYVKESPFKERVKMYEVIIFLVFFLPYKTKKKEKLPQSKTTTQNQNGTRVRYRYLTVEAY